MARSSAAVVAVDVDARDVEQVLEQVSDPLGPESMMRFMRGPVHTYFKEEIGNRFATQGDGALGFWDELAEPTKRIRRSQGFPEAEPINVRTGEMFTTVYDEADFFSTGEYVEMSKPGAAGRREPVATKIKTAQRGRPDNFLGYGPTPPRPFLGIDEADAEAVLLRLNVWLQQQGAMSFF